MAVPEMFDQTWRAVPESVPSARRAIVDHLADAATTDPPLSDIRLAVSEAISNVVVHAYRDHEPGLVRVRVAVEPPEIELMVQDDGSGMVPRPDTPGLGLGLPLIATLSDPFDVRAAPGGGTRLCMWFKTDPAEATLPH